MLVRCDRCAARGAACGQCILSAVIDASPSGVELDDAERRALMALAEAGLMPSLRPVRGRDPGGGQGGRRGDRRSRRPAGSRAGVPRAA